MQDKPTTDKDDDEQTRLKLHWLYKWYNKVTTFEPMQFVS